MSATELRQAAETLRERAEAATNVTGASDWFMESRGAHFIGEYGVRSSGGFVAGDTVEDEAAYIATMHPGIGLALADWLDEVWGWCEEGVGMIPGGNIGDAWIGVVREAKKMARLINGGAA